MPFTYDITTNIGRVRALTGDVDSTNPFLDDNEMTVYLELSEANVRLAAAMALEAMASRFNAILKKIENLDLKTDAPAMAREFRELAKQIRQDVNVAAAASVLEVASQVYTPAGYIEDEWNERYAGELL